MSLKISVITPSRNSADHVETAIRSVLDQKYDNFEHVVVDGASTDGTVKTLKRYSHLKWISEPDSGQSEAMNKGFLLSTGDIIVYLNTDDYFLPGAFQAVVPYFEKGAKVVVGKIKVEKEVGNSFINDPKVKHEEMLRHWELNAFPYNPVGYFYLRQVQEAVGGFNENNHDKQDLEFLLAASSMFEFTKTDRLLGVFRDYAETKTQKHQERKDYWCEENFRIIDYYLEKQPEEFVKKFQEDRRIGYEKLKRIQAWTKKQGQRYRAKIFEQFEGMKENARIDQASQYPTRELIRLLDKLSREFHALLKSKRWQVGNALIRAVEMLLLRPKEPLAIDRMARMFDDFQSWKASAPSGKAEIGKYGSSVHELIVRIEGLRHEFDTLLKSKRWQVGNALIRAVEMPLLRPKAPLATDKMEGIFSEIDEWEKLCESPAILTKEEQGQYGNLSLIAVDRKLYAEKAHKVPGNNLFPRDVTGLSAPNDNQRVLVIDRSLPNYDKDSGSLRMYSLLEILVDLGYQVSFIPDDLNEVEPYATDLRSLGVQTLFTEADVKDFLRTIGGKLAFVVLSRPGQAYKYLPFIRAHAINSKVIYDTVDLHWVRFERAALLSGNEHMHRMGERYKAIELFNASCSDAVLAITENEKERLLQENPELKVHTIPNIHSVEQKVRPFSERKGLMFIGGFMHEPNVDAVAYFVKDIFPVIRKELNGIQFFAVGTNPPETLLRLASHDVKVTGYVRDVSKYFERCRVFVSPLRYGAGMQGKIGQSMGYGLPVVTTKIGAEGFGLTDGDTAMIADTDESFADVVIRLYNDQILWSHISNRSLQHIESHFSKPVVRDKISKALDSILVPNHDISSPH